VGPDRVVVASPALDDDLGLAQSVEDLAVEQLIAKAGVEALDVAVLPRAASLDVSGLGTDSRDPFLHGLGDELRSVVGPDVSGDAPQDEEVGQNVAWLIIWGIETCNPLPDIRPWPRIDSRGAGRTKPSQL
jgi:hypothetical protein